MKKRQVPYDITYMGNLIYDTNELIYQTEINLENRIVNAKGREDGSVRLTDAKYYI